MSTCFAKESFYGMLSYTILCFGMVWSVWYAMIFLCYAIQKNCLLCHAMLYVEKDKHRTTLIAMESLDIKSYLIYRHSVNQQNKEDIQIVSILLLIHLHHFR